MSRERVYASNAERQRACRLRRAAGRGGSGPSPSRPAGRPASRPARLAALRGEAERLQQEYEGWLESVPEPLQEGEVAERLRETIEQLEEVVALLGEVQPPRGFGRD